MATIVRREVRKRGFFGKLFKFVFIAFNIVMALWFFGGMFNAGGMVANESTAAGQVGGAVGMAIGLGAVGIFWLAGDLILGVLVLATRGSKVIVEETSGS